MDDQNNNNNMPGGEPVASGTPPAPSQPEPVSEPTAPAVEPSQPQQEQKCMTCGNAASGGNCVPCGQGEASCTWPPAQGGGPGPSAPGEAGQGGPAPAV